MVLNKAMLIIILVTAIIAFSLGFIIDSSLNKKANHDAILIRQGPQNKYQYINPLLMVDANVKKKLGEFKDIETKINSVISEEHQKGNIDSVSVFFNDLNDGRWMDINESEKYNPASMMKIPVMIAIFKAAETNRMNLKQQIYYTGGDNINAMEYFKPTKSIKAGKTYTVDELLFYTIAYSDNNAVQLLLQTMDSKNFLEVYTDLGVSIPQKADDDYMTVKQYASFFRVLYNASYISRDYSEKALKYLTEPDFTIGLTAGVPANVKVAQKFGERTIFAPDGKVLERELHDCGIVYKPGHPYLLCVMTKGKDFIKMAQSIKSVSQETYDFLK